MTTFGRVLRVAAGALEHPERATEIRDKIDEAVRDGRLDPMRIAQAVGTDPEGARALGLDLLERLEQHFCTDDNDGDDHGLD